MVKTVDLVRHGETERRNCFCGSSDHALSDRGWCQMREALPTSFSWTLVVSSPLRRCAEFASAFAHENGLGFRLEAGFREMHFGEWEGRSAEEIWTREPQAMARFWSDPDRYPPPGAEPLTSFQDRVLAAWNRLVSAEAKNILVIAHAGTIRVLLGHVLATPANMLLRLQVHHAAATRIRVYRDADGHAVPNLVFHACSLSCLGPS